MMIALKTHHNIGSNGKHVGSPKTNPSAARRQIPQPIKSWTSKPVRINGKPRENGIITSPRMLTGGLTGKAVPVKQSVGGEWALKECEEHTTWVNGLLKKGRHRPIGDLRKSLSDGLMLVTLIEILFHSKISGIQTRPIIRAQRLENIHLCLRFLEGKGVDIKHLNPEEVTDGNLQTALEVVSAIRKRFETNYTGSSSINNGSSSHSIDSNDNLSMAPTTSTGREGSINSQMSGTSMAHTPRSLHNGDAKGHVNGDILPGTLGDSAPEESPRISLDRDKIISTTTEISTQGTSHQHGVEMRRQKFRDLPATSQTAIRPQPLRPPPMAWNSANSSLTNGKSPAVRESLSMTVEERLKSLLDTPNPGGMSGGSQYLYDEGELLELPPPKLRSYLNDDDDDDDDDEDNAEETQLHAMLEDPDRFEDYPKDWDRYVSGYVPSSKAEKKEGPRAQALLDRQADNTPPTSQNRTLPFFHAPPTQHMGPMQGTPNTNGYHNGHDSRGNSADPNGMYNMQTPNSRLQNPAYQSPGSPGNPRYLPSYQDHIQRHAGRQQQPQYSRSRGHDSAPRGHDPDGSGGGATTPSAFRPTKNYDQPRTGEHLHHHQRSGQQLINHHVHNRTPNNAQHIPMENIRPNHAYSNPLHRSNHDHRNNNGFPPHIDSAPPARTLNEPYMDSRGFQSFVPSPSSSSSRSNTPELPPLSPASTPSDTPPGSPDLDVKRKSRSISVSSFPYSLRSSHSGGKEVEQTLQKKKGKSPSTGRHVSVPSKAPEMKQQNSRSSVGKGKRKITTRQRAATLQSLNGDSSQKKKTQKALPNTHRHDNFADSTSDSDSRPPPAKPERKPKKKSMMPSIPQPPQIGDDEDMDGPSADGIRQQLVALESMYKEILTVIGTNKGESEAKKPVRKQISTMASPRATVARPKSAAKTQKQREKDIKTVNKRFARVESHVVTLARSVASLSSELRSQNAILREIDSLRSEVDSLRESSFDTSRDSMFSNGTRFRPILSPHTSPQKIKKLTKFFGEEPPLLKMFLQELGYEKYAAIFETEGIGMLELPYLSEERLELIGIPIGPRLRIMQEAHLMI